MYYKTPRESVWLIYEVVIMLNECMTLAVKNQWNGMVDWNGGIECGMEYWNKL